MKFQLNSFDCGQLTDRALNSIANDQREITPKYTKQSYGSCYDTSSYCAVQLYEVSFKYL